MESISRFSQRLLPTCLAENCLINPITSPFRLIPSLQFHPTLIPTSKPGPSDPNRIFSTRKTYRPSSSSSTLIASAGWILGLGDKKPALPEIVKAGDPVLHESAQEVEPGEIGSDRIQKIIDDMIKAMRTAPGVGLAAPQIGIPLRIIVLEDTKEYISYDRKDVIKAQERRPFDLLVILNPKLRKKGNRTAFFFEGCLSVDGFRAVVERHLQVEVTGLSRNGKPIKVDASGWKARILQHECDHLDGTLYVDKMVPRTFRTVQNIDLPLAVGCPKLGAR
ncbi:hypothetical protein VitviT2T_013604 [Vitis vinifera]|uniref:Peptide deformylase n=2 Tax=Vitis vinifera TaxID=29760 RepID=A0ABY9CLF0_VITVI|eukprot:XP_002281834.1 PREDICTED: peptide deformylase 1A, chloroplastic/mitochondrial [Vitis vinifera]